MAILHQRRLTPRSSEPRPTTEEVRAFMDMIRRESIAELHYSASAPPVDVAAEVAAWEYDKNARPWEYARRLHQAELGDRVAAALRSGGAR